jgi:hypothetical protein
MKRTFWFLAGVGTTLGVLHKVDQTKENLNPEKFGAMAASFVGSIFSSVSSQIFNFIDDVRVASKLREREIYDSIDPDQG